MDASMIDQSCLVAPLVFCYLAVIDCVPTATDTRVCWSGFASLSLSRSLSFSWKPLMVHRFTVNVHELFHCLKLRHSLANGPFAFLWPLSFSFCIHVCPFCNFSPRWPSLNRRTAHTLTGWQVVSICESILSLLRRACFYLSFCWKTVRLLDFEDSFFLRQWTGVCERKVHSRSKHRLPPIDRARVRLSVVLLLPSCLMFDFSINKSINKSNCST